MPTTSLADVLERNARHADSLSPTFFESVQDVQEPAAVSVCCADSRVSQEAMWDVQEPGWLFTPSTIGNQVWDIHDGERVVDGSVLYPIEYTGTEVLLVVGHTGCGAITAALETLRGDKPEKPAGVGKWVDLLAPVIEGGLADDRIDPDREVSLVDQLAEYNVDKQIEFLQSQADIPTDTSLFGFVYDFQGVYGDVPGRAYLVNVDGETDIATLEAAVPDAYLDHVHRLL
ncbi:carbonic anhydrase [Halovenus sp. HT40]|uniref:carbonic anhydrase n=1 Tax=Halovenus sp. HT40 TaxID=3126691 RepID=UPI00300F0D55